MHPVYAHMYLMYICAYAERTHLEVVVGRAGYGLNMLVYVISEATRNGHKFQKFSWESMHPQTPLIICVVTIALCNSLSNKSCIKT